MPASSSPPSARGVVEFLGELGPAERDVLFAGALATVMLGAWPEPFGLVAAESMAVGTPVIARRAGALVETVRDGVDGFLVDDVTEALLALELVDRLDRPAVAAGARARFSAARMAEEYEAAYRRLLFQAVPPGAGVMAGSAGNGVAGPSAPAGVTGRPK